MHNLLSGPNTGLQLTESPAFRTGKMLQSPLSYLCAFRLKQMTQRDRERVGRIVGKLTAII